MSTTTPTTDETTDELPDSVDPKAEAVTDAWEGTPLYASYGYNQTNVTFARIVDVSDSGKTVLAQLVDANVEATDSAGRHLAAGEDTYGDEFRLQVRVNGGRVTFRGSYPYIDGDMDNGTRLDSLFPVREDDTVRATAPNRGH